MCTVEAAEAAPFAQYFQGLLAWGMGAAEKGQCHSLCAMAMSFLNFIHIP